MRGVLGQPAEQSDVLMDELEKTLDELVVWVKKINKTNSLSPFDQDRSLSDALAERDGLMQQRNMVDEGGFGRFNNIWSAN